MEHGYELRIALTNDDNELRNKYETAINAHNAQIYSEFPNAGFDLFFPQQVLFEKSSLKMASMQVKAEMISITKKYTSYYMYPRSSMSKTRLMLANHVGIIDSGYRGELIGAFKNISATDDETVDKYSRLLQICSPSLEPFKVRLVDESELSSSERGAGGFGSTGK